MQYPTIHLNGTSASTLQDEIMKAHWKLKAARDAVADMTVHSRDYYVKADPNAFMQACDEHRARMLALDKIVNDLSDMYQRIVDQT